MTTESYRGGKYNKQIYSTWRTKWEEFFPSERYYFQGEGAVPGVSAMSILDVGCAAGGLGTALLDSVSSGINYTGIDPDEEAIILGRQADPRLGLVSGHFPEDYKSDRKFEMVTSFSLLPQVPDWKSFLLSLKSVSTKYINLSIGVRLDGPTVVDIDVSYLYYFDSGERVHQVIHNIYELLNFCSITEMEASELRFFGYRTKDNQSDAFRALPDNKTIKGNLLIVIEEGRYAAGRTGGCSNPEMLTASGVSRFNVRPQLEVNIEGNVYRNYNEIDTFRFD